MLRSLTSLTLNNSKKKFSSKLNKNRRASKKRRTTTRTQNRPWKMSKSIFRDKNHQLNKYKKLRWNNQEPFQVSCNFLQRWDYCLNSKLILIMHLTSVIQGNNRQLSACSKATSNNKPRDNLPPPMCSKSWQPLHSCTTTNGKLSSARWNSSSPFPKTLRKFLRIKTLKLQKSNTMEVFQVLTSKWEAKSWKQVCLSSQSKITNSTETLETKIKTTFMKSTNGHKTLTLKVM